MDLKEIVNRGAHKPVHQDECLYVIREYVLERKGESIEPALNPYNPIGEVHLMNIMFCKASAWLKENLE